MTLKPFSPQINVLSMFLWQQYASFPEKSQRVALRDEQGNCFTWQALNQQISQVAQQLSEQGVTSDSNVAFVGKNSFHILLLYLASIQLGARILGINPHFTTQKIADLFQQNQIQFYFSKSILNLSEIAVQPLRIEHINKNVQPTITMGCDPQRPATMTLTSGSSGTPKAVVHNMQAHLDNALGVCQLMNFQTSHSWLLSLPLYHISGQGIVWRWLLAGATLHLAGADFNTSVAQATHISLVPTQLQRFLAFLQQGKNYQTKHILLGGTHIPLTLTQALQPYGIQAYSGYGMTEMASTVFAKVCDAKKGVGQALKGREFLLIEQEIWLRGAGLALGYWQQGSIKPLLNQQGWFATKDKGIWFDDELQIVGRLDNMFISGGENIQPEEIEYWLQSNPKVAQAFVLPIEDPEFGQRPVAFVQFQQNFTRQAVAELRLWLADKIEKFKQPIAYFHLEPQGEQGNIKISRMQLKQQLAQSWVNKDYF